MQVLKTEDPLAYAMQLFQSLAQRLIELRTQQQAIEVLASLTEEDFEILEDLIQMFETKPGQRLIGTNRNNFLPGFRQLINAAKLIKEGPTCAA